MELRGRIMTGNLLIVILILQFCASFQQESGSFSLSSFSFSFVSSIASTAITDRRPCVFRGELFMHKELFQIGRCINCTCINSTVVCRSESCPSDPGCEKTERVFTPHECCPRCPVVQTVTVKSLKWNLREVGRSFYRRETPIRLDIRLEFKESETLEGVGMWKVGIFGSSDSAGFGQRHYEVNQTLNEDQASMAKTGTLMNIRNITSDFQVGSIGCDHVRYVCVEFSKGYAPFPPFNLHFDDDSEDSSSNPFKISCKELKCSKRNMRQKVKLMQRNAWD